MSSWRYVAILGYNFGPQILWLSNPLKILCIASNVIVQCPVFFLKLMKLYLSNKTFPT